MPSTKLLILRELELALACGIAAAAGAGAALGTVGGGVAGIAVSRSREFVLLFGFLCGGRAISIGTEADRLLASFGRLMRSLLWLGRSVFARDSLLRLLGLRKVGCVAWSLVSSSSLKTGGAGIGSGCVGPVAGASSCVSDE